MSCAEPVFVCEDVSYAYLGKFPAVTDVSLTVCPGERVALLGANGSGKSTLLKLLDGLIVATSGRVLAYGTELTEDNLDDVGFGAQFRSRVGFVFQNSDAQLFSSTVREELAFGCLQLGLDRDEVRRRVADILELLDIEDLADRTPFQLSGGEKKKVAIGSVLVMNPQVILFDEPTAALDPRSGRWLAGLLAQLGRAGKTIVVASHDLAAVPGIADRVVIFGEDHRVLADTGAEAALADEELLRRANLI